MTGKQTSALIDDCFVLDRDRVSHSDAIALLRGRIAPIAARTAVPLSDAHGRILAEAAVARAPVPAHTNAAVDGYAFHATDAVLAAEAGLPVIGRAAAGHGLATPAAPQSAARIFTGAIMPVGHDTVAMQEDCTRFESGGVAHVRIPRGLKQGANVRKAGEDVAVGAEVLAPGAVLRPQDIAALASIGLADVPVFERLKVAILSSGDEVIEPGRPLAPGQVYDANGPMLEGLIRSAGAFVHRLGIAADTPAAVDAALSKAAARYDVIITTGGASQGEEDHLVSALDRLGQRHLWQLAIKPGRPMAFGQIGRCVVVGLPGNPVAVFVCFLMYVFPLLRALGGAAWPEPQRFMLPAAFEIGSRKTGRREFWRGSLTSLNGAMAVEKFARDGSGLISGLTASDGLIDVPEDTVSVRRGDPVAFIPYTTFGL